MFTTPVLFVPKNQQQQQCVSTFMFSVSSGRTSIPGWGVKSPWLCGRMRYVVWLSFRVSDEVFLNSRVDLCILQ